MTGYPNPFQVRVAQIALSVARQHGFALGGGHALLAHGLIHRPTEDIDLFTDTEDGIHTATELVRAALEETGLHVRSPPSASDELTDVVYGMDDAFGELEVSDGSASVSISLAQLARQRAPIIMAIGPVLHLDDLLGSKVCALGTRAMVRDFVDVGAALSRGYGRIQLIEHDPGLAEEDLQFAMQRLDHMPDAMFLPYGFDSPAVSALRRQFEDWPR